MTVRSNSKPIHIRQSVFDAVKDWKTRQDADTGLVGEGSGYPPAESILQSIPRRQQLLPEDEGHLWLPYVDPFIYRGSFWQSLSRSFTWFNMLTTILLGNFFDWILRRDTLPRRAVRLRTAMEKAGGTFVKLGQQLAMRVDLLPWAYCVELSKMLDRMIPFPTEQALKAVERTIGKPWQEVFAVFDPKPIGSASISCVYQATLKDGTKVVVKVRRPRIRELFTADLQVLDWLAGFAEYLTIIRPGFTQKLRTELREVLLEELDFHREARFQDIFRRNAAKAGWKFFNSPHVYFEYSGHEVLVQEFVSGLWLWEVTSIIEQRDTKGLALLREMNIDPAIVARRILSATFWSADEHVFFHADPHPANILIRPNNEITFIDFGSCGSFNNSQKIALEQMVLSMNKQDAEAMARAAINLMEPLPPVDIPALVKHAQEEYMHLLHTFNTPSEYTQYWERTSARQWFVLIQVARKFNLPMNLHMLRMIRATLLYDSIVLRLDHRLDRYYEYTQFMKVRAKFIKRRWRNRLRDNSGDGFFLAVEDIGNSFNDLMIRAQDILSRPMVNLGSTVDKWIFTASVFSRMVGRILWVTLLAIGLVELFRYLTGDSISFTIALRTVITNKYYLAFLVATNMFSARLILVRLSDRDTVGGRN